MRLLNTLLLSFFFCVTLQAQDKSEEDNVKAVINTFFEGMHTKDSAKIAKTLHADVKFQTTFTNKSGKNVLRTHSVERFLNDVGDKKNKNMYFEKLLSYDIRVNGNLASVWTPYEFYLNEKLNHCGANSFQLFNNNGAWEIVFLFDMRKYENCTSDIDKK